MMHVHSFIIYLSYWAVVDACLQPVMVNIQKYMYRYIYEYNILYDDEYYSY